MNQPWVSMCSPSWTPLPPPSPSHPSGSSQCTSPEHPVSYIEPGLEIYFTYDNIHVSMIFSQIIPPLVSPTESKRLFFISASLLLSCTWSEVKSLSRVRLFATPWTVDYQTPWSMGFSRQEWIATGVGCHCLLRGIFLTQGTNPDLPHCRQTLYVWATREAQSCT